MKHELTFLTIFFLFQSKRFKLAPNRSNECSLKIEEDEDELSIEDSQSLPSSQEDLEQKLKREVSVKDNEHEDSEYESAEEK